MKILSGLTLAALFIVSGSAFAAERVAFSGSECVGNGSKGSSAPTVGNSEITCPITLPYAWGTRKITKARVNLSTGYSQTCAIYSTDQNGNQLAYQNLAFNAGDQPMNLVLSRNYAHLRCAHFGPSYAGGSIKIHGYIIESDI